MFNILSGVKEPTISPVLLVGILTFTGTVFTLLWTIIWSMYSRSQQKSDADQQRKEAAENTAKLDHIQQEIIKTNRLHDYRVQTLRDTRETLIEAHKAYDYIAKIIQVNAKIDKEIVLEKRGQLTVALAELTGLAQAIGNQALTDLVNDTETFSFGETEQKIDNDTVRKSAIKVTQIHYKIAKLLEETTQT